MIQVEWGKVIIAVTAILTGIVLIIVGEHTAGVGMVTTIVGYTFGNGRLISTGKAPVPMIAKADPGQPGTWTPTPADPADGP